MKNLQIHIHCGTILTTVKILTHLFVIDNSNGKIAGFFPALLRYNWHSILCEFTVYNKSIWCICEWLPPYVTTVTSHNCPFFFVVENTAGLLFLVWHRIINCVHHSVHSIPRTYSSNIWKFVPWDQHHPYSPSPSPWQPTFQSLSVSSAFFRFYM